MALLQETFYGRVISRHGDINWPPRSCTIWHHYPFFVELREDRVYADKPSILEHLKTDIRQVMAEGGTVQYVSKSDTF